MKAKFYKTATGAEVVKAYLRALPKEERRTLGHEIDLLERYGLTAPGVDVKYERRGLYAIRSKAKSAQRALFMVKGDEIWILYVFQKDDQKLLKRHRDVAEKRMAEILGRR